MNLNNMNANLFQTNIIIGAINSGKPIEPKTMKSSSQKFCTMKSELQSKTPEFNVLKCFVTN